MTFLRYALYFAPPAEADWTQWASAWLGWDMETGQPLAHPDCELDVAAITETPRKYGLHATLKPPMRLADGRTEAALRDACARFAATQPALRLEGLELARLGRFLALRTVGDESALNQLAAACVEALDGFRAPLNDAELTRRRGNGLSPAQEAHLAQWGYPHVMELFRFHITLSGKLDNPTATATERFLAGTLVPQLPKPFEIKDLALVGERPDGRFELIQRYPLSSG